MGGRFSSRGFMKNNGDDDDLVKRQLSALEGAVEKNDVDSNDAKTEEIKAAVPQQPSETIKKSILQKDMVVTGSVTSSSALLISGTVDGNVTCENEVTIDGNVGGNIKAASIKVLSGRITGDIESKNSVEICKCASIKGNIKGKDLLCDGKIEGNTNVLDKVSIKENSVIFGDIICEKLSIAEGAVFTGNIQTNISKQDKPTGKNNLPRPENKTEGQKVNTTSLKQYI